MKLTKIGEFLKRSKIPIDIEDDVHYNRVTIRINHNGVSLRDSEIGKKIGTKKQFILKAGQFIVSKIDARYGAFGIAPIEVDNTIITGNFWAYDVDTDLINIDWFNQFTNSPAFYEVCERASSGITHRKYLDEKFFLNYQILLPSVEEQLIQIKKINSQKVSFGKLSTELSHQLNLVKKLRQQLLQDAVQGKLVSQNKKDEPASELLKKIKAEKLNSVGLKPNAKKKTNSLALKSETNIKPEEIPFQIPDNWVWCRLGEILTEIKYGTSQSCDYDYTKNSKVLRIPNVSSGVLDGEDLKYTNLSEKEISELALEKDDILIIRSNGSRELVGRTVLVTPEFIGFAYAGYLVRFRFNKELTNARYFWTATKAPFFRELLEKPLRTTVGINNINTQEMSNLFLPLPPLEEQNRIVQKLDELMAYCNKLEASIKQSQAQNETLLQQVLREALRPPAGKAGKEVVEA